MSEVKLATVSRNPFAIAVMMVSDPVPVVPMNPNPFPVAIVVAFNPDLTAMRVGAYIKGCEEDKSAKQTLKTSSFIFNFSSLLIGWDSSNLYILL